MSTFSILRLLIDFCFLRRSPLSADRLLRCFFFLFSLSLSSTISSSSSSSSGLTASFSSFDDAFLLANFSRMSRAVAPASASLSSSSSSPTLLIRLRFVSFFFFAGELFLLLPALALGRSSKRRTRQHVSFLTELQGVPSEEKKSLGKSETSDKSSPKICSMSADASTCLIACLV